MPAVVLHPPVQAHFATNAPPSHIKHAEKKNQVEKVSQHKSSKKRKLMKLKKVDLNSYRQWLQRFTF
jgi:hypothetical protein